MKPRLLTSIFTVLLILIIVSCSKDSSNSGGGTVMTPLEKRAELVAKYVVGKSFIPVDFYASKAIDYNQDDAVTQSIIDLKPFIMPYLKDDSIVLRDDHHIYVNQVDSLYYPLTGDTLPPVFDSILWEVTTMKATNEVFLDYLNYTYESRRYTIESFDDTGMLAYVIWRNKLNSADTARLYTRFLRK